MNNQTKKKIKWWKVILYSAFILLFIFFGVGFNLADTVKIILFFIILFFILPILVEAIEEHFKRYRLGYHQTWKDIKNYFK